VDAAADAGADRVELYTGPWAAAYATGGEAGTLAAYRAAAGRATSRGMGVNAGHDLDLENLGPFLDALPDVAEVSIGQALVADALELGLRAAVAAYLVVIRRAGAPGSSPEPAPHSMRGQARRR
jgi:pyridoxine 5-phosphate synthase